MSRQINFFAAPEDLTEFHSWLIAIFPEMSAVLIDADRKGADRIRPLTGMANSLGQVGIYLIPSWALDSIVLCPPGSKITVRSSSSPVLEYDPPCADEASGSLKVGRVYWDYSGPLSAHQKRDIDAIFNWIRSRSRPNRKGSMFRMFPSAAKYRVLRGWVGESISNPFAVESGRDLGSAEEDKQTGRAQVAGAESTKPQV
jgi:hypothetical protein